MRPGRTSRCCTACSWGRRSPCGTGTFQAAKKKKINANSRIFLKKTVLPFCSTRSSCRTLRCKLACRRGGRSSPSCIGRCGAWCPGGNGKNNLKNKRETARCTHVFAHPVHAAGERLADRAIGPAEPLAALADAGGHALAALLGAVVAHGYARCNKKDYLQFPISDMRNCALALTAVAVGSPVHGPARGLVPLALALEGLVAVAVHATGEANALAAAGALPDTKGKKGYLTSCFLSKHHADCSI